MADFLKAWLRLGPTILSDPNNDRLRLQLAAALEEPASEQHSTRAHFIRLQLALARTSLNSSQWMSLVSESDSLLLNHKEEWLPSWVSIAEVHELDFHRGLVEFVSISLSSLSLLRKQIFSESPIRHLKLFAIQDSDQLKNTFDVLESEGYLSRLVSLQIDAQDLTDTDVGFLNRPSLRNLRWLSMANNQIERNGALALTKGNFAGLEFVDLHGNPFDPVEKLTFDQGIVIERSMDHVPDDFPRVPWLTQNVVSGLLFQPSRWDSINGIDPEDESGNLVPPPMNLNNSGTTRGNQVQVDDVVTAG
jgi:hypothetical protein